MRSFVAPRTIDNLLAFEDIIKDNEQEIQKITDSFINNLNSIQVEKEKELLEV